MNKEQKQFCQDHNLTEDQFFGREEIKGSLDLNSLTSIPEGFNPTVGWNLNLYSLTSIPEGFNPTVGGDLNLESLTSIPKGFNPTVGRDLYLNSLTSIPEGFNPTVGDEIFTEKWGWFESSSKPDLPLTWEDGKYILIDGLFSEVIARRKNVLELRQIGKTDTWYAVTNGSLWAHGESIKEAKQALEDKIEAHKRQSEPIYPDTIITDKYYHQVTGACMSGIEHWKKQQGISKEQMTAEELLPILKKTGAYGSEKFNELYVTK